MTSFWVLVCFGVIGLPHTAVRCISYKDSKAVHRGIILGTIVVAILMFGMHLTWCAGSRGDPGSDHPGSGHPYVDGESTAAVCRRDLPCRANGGDHVDNQRAVIAEFRYDHAWDLYLNLHPEQLNNEKRLKADVGDDPHGLARCCCWPHGVRLR